MSSMFRRSIISATKDRGFKGGFSKRDFYDSYRIPKDELTTFMFINAKYIDPNPMPEELDYGIDGNPKPVEKTFFKFRKHRAIIKGNGREYYPWEVCSAGINPHNPQPCAGCYAMDAGYKNISIGDSFAFGVIHLVTYHGHPLFDEDTGQFVVKKDNSGPVIIYSECRGNKCNFCRILSGQSPIVPQGSMFPPYKMQDITSVFGRRRYIDIGKNHLSNLEEWDTRVSGKCFTSLQLQNGQMTTCSQQLSGTTYNCPHCDTVIIDPKQDQRTAKQIAEAALKPYPCLKCGRPVILNLKVSCDRCGNPTQKSLLDVVLSAGRQGEGTKSQLVLNHFYSVEEFGAKIPPQLLGGKTFQQLISELNKQYEFSSIFAPRTPQEQAKNLRIELPAQFGIHAQSMYSQNVASPSPYQQAVQPPQPQQPQQPAYVPYNTGAPSTPVQPGPIPFIPPAKPNFGQQ